MGVKQYHIFIISLATIFVLFAGLLFFNPDISKNVGGDSLGSKIWNAALKLLVLGDGGIGGCGNSIVEENLGEECDDGNSVAEDGCNPSCKWENMSMAYSWCGTTSCPVSRIYSQTGSAYSSRFWHIVPVAYVEIADISKPGIDKRSEVQRIKNITDNQPVGYRAILNYFFPRYSDYINTVGDKDNIIISETCTDINDLSTCERMQDVEKPRGCSSPYIIVQGYALNYRSPWWDNWIAENQTRLRTFLDDYIALDGKQIDYFQSDYEMGFDVGFGKPYSVSFIPTTDTSATPCNEPEYYPAFNERVVNWWNGIQNDPRFPQMEAKLSQYGFVIPADKTLYEYINPKTYSWYNYATVPQLIWNSVAQEMTAKHLNDAYYNVLKEYYPNIEMTDNSNYLNSATYPKVGNLHPYGTGVLVGTHQDVGTYSNITFSTFKQGMNGIRSAALVTPKTPFRVWLSHWSYKVDDANRQIFNLNYAKYWTENVLHTLLTGSDGISWWNASADGTDQDTRTTADRTAESTVMNTLLQQFDSLTFFRQDRATLVSNLISDSTNYFLTGMRVPNHYNLYRFTPNQDSGQTYEVLQENPAIFLVNNTTRIMIPGGEIYTSASNVAPYGYWVIQPFNSGNPIVETGVCINTCVTETPDPDPDPQCTNDCTANQTKCSDTTHKQTCGQYDADTCLEWSTATVCSGSTACGYGTCPDDKKPAWRCDNGTCSYLCNNDDTCSLEGNVPEPDQCTDECTANQTKCSDTTHKQTCGQYDSDTCLEWSSATICQGSTACDYGNCSPTQKPSWSCKDGSCVYVCQNSQSCKGIQTYIKNYKKVCYNNDIYWYDSTGQIQSMFQECPDNHCVDASCVSSDSTEATANVDNLENTDSPEPEVVESEKEQSFIDLLVEFIASNILLTIVSGVVVYLVFAVGGYMLFRKVTG